MDTSARVCQFLGTYPFQDELFIEIDPKSKTKPHFKFRAMSTPTQPNCSPQQMKEVSHQGSRKSAERTVGEVRQYL